LSPIDRLKNHVFLYLFLTTLQLFRYLYVSHTTRLHCFPCEAQVR